MLGTSPVSEGSDRNATWADGGRVGEELGLLTLNHLQRAMLLTIEDPDDREGKV